MSFWESVLNIGSTVAGFASKAVPVLGVASSVLDLAGNVTDARNQYSQLALQLEKNKADTLLAQAGLDYNSQTALQQEQAQMEAANRSVGAVASQNNLSISQAFMNAQSQNASQRAALAQSGLANTGAVKRTQDVQQSVTDEALSAVTEQLRTQSQQANAQRNLLAGQNQAAQSLGIEGVSTAAQLSNYLNQQTLDVNTEYSNTLLNAQMDQAAGAGLLWTDKQKDRWSTGSKSLLAESTIGQTVTALGG